MSLRLRVFFALVPSLLCMVRAQAAVPEMTHDAVPPAVEQKGKPATSTAPTVGRGELLYETFCIGCHASTVHIREKRRATSAEGVESWVRRWSSSLKLDWSDEDIAAVRDYLIRRYYKFAPPTN